MHEKRKFKRVPFMASVSFCTEDGNQIDGECIDISMIGIFLKSCRALPVNTLGDLTLVQECGEDRLTILATARVARNIPADNSNPEAGMGLEFVDLDPDSSITLYNIIRYQDTD